MSILGVQGYPTIVVFYKGEGIFYDDFLEKTKILEFAKGVVTRRAIEIESLEQLEDVKKIYS